MPEPTTDEMTAYLRAQVAERVDAALSEPETARALAARGFVPADVRERLIERTMHDLGRQL